MDAFAEDKQVEVAPPRQNEARDNRCRESGYLWQRQSRECLPEIDTDRPHRTDTPATVPPGYVQSETGIIAYETPTTDADSTVHFFDSLLKLGVSNRVDLQIGYAPVTMRHRADRAGWLGMTNVATGRSLTLRSKVRLYGTGHDPLGITLAPVVSVPLHRHEAVDLGGTLLFGAELSEHLSLEVNASLSYEREEGPKERSLHFVPCSALTMRLFGPLKLFGELYFERPLSGAYQTWSGTVDSGLLWLIGNDVQVDAAVYLGTNARVPAATMVLGFSVRL